MTKTLCRFKPAACSLAVVCAFAAAAPAQTRGPDKSPKAKVTAGARRQRTREAGARLARERRLAADTLVEVADGAREIDDPFARAVVLTDSAAALWPVDEPSARGLFRRAWEAATAADEATRAEETGVERPRHDTAARREVVGAAAQRDPRLAEELLGELRAWMEKHAVTGEGEDAGAAESRGGPRRCVETTVEGQRLALADTLLAEGAHEAAAEVVAPVVRCGADANFVVFLLRLRERAAPRADALFLRLLEVIRADAGAGPNSALVSATYVVTPGLLTEIDETGTVRFVNVAPAAAGAPAARPVAPPVRAAFYETAAQVLLRPPPSAGAGAGKADAFGPAAFYLAIERLLPFFQRDAPRHAPALQARRASLSADLQPARREMIERQAGVRNLTSGNSHDPLRPFLDAIGRESDPAARDGLRLDAVRAAARRKLWERARQLANDITDDAGKRAALFVIAARQVASLADAFAEVEAEDVERTVAFVRRADLPAALRSLGLAQAAQLAARRRDRPRALELLDEALSYAAQAGADKPTQAAAAVMAAEHAARLDSPRLWEALAAAVGAVNADEGFSGAGVASDVRPGAAPSLAEAETLAEVFGDYSLAGIFGAAARRDFPRAVAEARVLEDGLTRAVSLVAAARAVLERKEPARPAAP